MSDDRIEFRLDLPRKALEEERSAAGPDYVVGQESALAPDPLAVEARFVDPLSIIVYATVALLVERIVNHFLVRDGRGVLIDARSRPPVVSRLEDVPEGFITLIKPDGTTQAIDAGKSDDASLIALIKPLLAQAG